MAPISCLLNGIPWTRGDTDTLDDLSPRDQRRVLDWIAKNIHYSGSGETYSSYELKHHMEHDIGLYTTNNQFKHAMLKMGYKPIEYNELNWEYTVTSDKSPYAVMKERERREKEEAHKRYVAECNKYRDSDPEPEPVGEKTILLLNDKQRILLENQEARIIGASPQTDRIAVIPPLFVNHIAEIMIEDTGIIYFDANKGAFCSVLEFCNEERLMNLLGNIGEAIIVHRCNDNSSINRKWLSIATMSYIDHEDADQYTAVGTGFKSTKIQHPRLYNPFDTQNDIIWIDDEENKVIRHDLSGKVGSYAALQIKASTNGEKYVLKDLLSRRYVVPLVYYPINDDFGLIASKAPNAQPGVDFIDVRETDRTAFDELMYYWRLLSKLYNGTIKAIDVVNEATSLPALRNGLYASTIQITTASYAMF